MNIHSDIVYRLPRRRVMAGRSHIRVTRSPWSSRPPGNPPLPSSPRQRLGRVRGTTPNSRRSTPYLRTSRRCWRLWLLPLSEHSRRKPPRMACLPPNSQHNNKGCLSQYSPRRPRAGGHRAVTRWGYPPISCRC